MKINKISINRTGFQMIVKPPKPKLTYRNHNKRKRHNEPNQNLKQNHVTHWRQARKNSRNRSHAWL